MSEIGALHVDNPRVAAKGIRQLAITHINRRNPGSAVLQQAIGEAAGGSADIKKG